MAKIRNLLAGAAIAGTMALGLGAAPAQATTAPAAADSASAFAKNFTYWSHNKQAFYKGYWYKKGGKYYTGGKLYHTKFTNGHYGYVWLKWYDKFGKPHTKYYKWFKKTGFFQVKDFLFTKDLDVRVCEGFKPTHSCGGWHDVF